MVTSKLRDDNDARDEEDDAVPMNKRGGSCEEDENGRDKPVNRGEVVKGSTTSNCSIGDWAGGGMGSVER